MVFAVIAGSGSSLAVGLESPAVAVSRSAPNPVAYALALTGAAGTAAGRVPA